MGLSQDPVCEMIVTINNVSDHSYTYHVITQLDFGKQSLESVAEDLKRGAGVAGQHRESSLLRSKTGDELIISYDSDHCYPNYGNEDQLRIILVRQNKQTKEIEMMYGSAPLIIGRTEILIPEFIPGERPCEVFMYVQRNHDEANTDYQYKGYHSLHATKVFFK